MALDFCFLASITGKIRWFLQYRLPLELAEDLVKTSWLFLWYVPAALLRKESFSQFLSSVARVFRYRIMYQQEVGLMNENGMRTNFQWRLILWQSGWAWRTFSPYDFILGNILDVSVERLLLRVNCILREDIAFYLTKQVSEKILVLTCGWLWVDVCTAWFKDPVGELAFVRDVPSRNPVARLLSLGLDRALPAWRHSLF